MASLKQSNLGSPAGSIILTEALARMERAVRAVPGIRQAAAILRQEPKRTLPLHLSELALIRSGSAAEGGTSSKAPPTIADKSTLDGRAADETEERPVAAKPLALSYGGDLHYEPDDPLTLPDALRRAVAVAKDKGTLYLLPDGSQSYQSYPTLLEEAQRVLGGLRRLGLKPGDSVLFQFENNRNFVTAYWACILGGFLPTPVAVAPIYSEDNAVVKKLGNAWKLLDQPLILTDKALESSVRSLALLWNAHQLRVAAVEPLLEGPEDREWYLCKPEDFVLNLLTSGSTGVPKCVQHRHSSIISRIKGTILVSGFTQDEISLNWMPLDHVGGIVMFNLRDVFLCCQHVNARVDSFLANPLIWLDWIDTYRATNTWAPNFAFALINDREREIQQGHWDLSSMRNIMNAGEAVVSKTAYRFLQILGQHGLPANAIYPAYGMSETSSAIVYSNMSRDDERLGVHHLYKRSLRGNLQFVGPGSPESVTFTDVGPPIPGVSVRIVDRGNRLLSEDRIGRLQVKGPTIMAGYYRNPEANAESFVGDGWFNTGDLAFLHEGRLTITGREKDIIIIRGANFANHELESVVEALPGVEVTYAAACAVPNPDNQTDQLAIFFVPTSHQMDDLVETIREIRTTLSRVVGLQPDFVVPVERASFPKTNSGKIQRAELLRNLQAGKFDTILKEIDQHEENQNTLPHWFFETVWRVAESDPTSESLPDGTYLVFVPESAGFGLALEARLRECGRNPVNVRAAESFARLASGRYEINPRKKDHYRQLIDAVLEETGSISMVIHAWGYGHWGDSSTLQELEESQFQLPFSVLWIVQELANRGVGDVPLSVVTTNGQWVRDDDTLDYQKSTLSGLIRTMAAESTLESIHHVDLWPADPARHVDQILQELGRPGKDLELAYRHGQRFIPRLRPVPVGNGVGSETILTPGSLYLMVGGLGGLGFELAQYLLSILQLKLLIIGRTPIESGDPSKGAWHYHELVEFGEVLYHAVDVTNEAQLRLAIHVAEERWKQPLTGVLHLAGESIADYWTDLDRHSIRYESVDNFLSMYRAKVFGTWTLNRALRDHPEAVFILFSSVNGTFGGSSFGAYAAANSFLDGFARYSQRQLKRPMRCLAWTMWSEVGMNRDNPAIEAAVYRGFRSISVSQGLASFLVGLGLGRTHLLIGLDSSKSHVSAWLETPEPTQPVIVVYFTADSEYFPVDRLRSAILESDLGRDLRVRMVQLPAMPAGPSGEVDRELLARSDDPVREKMTGVAHREPVTKFEKEIATIWREVLNVPRVGLQDSFFDLGGNSLRAVQIMARMSSHTGTQLPMRMLYQHRTLGALTSALQPVANVE